MFRLPTKLLLMYYNHPFNIPSDLLNRFEYGEDISILVGENGSGKSSLLNELAKYFLARSTSKVIVIVNTIHDKFNIRNTRFEALKASSGKSIVKTTLKSALLMLIADDLKRINSIAVALEYVKFDPVIGLKLTGLKWDFEALLNLSKYDEKDKEEMIYLLRQYKKKISYSDEYLRINLYRNEFNDLKDSYNIGILKYEKQLKALRIIREIDVFLSKDHRFIPASQGSSGELTMVTSIVYLITAIQTRSVILIDEPENSLHPKWQIEYIRTIIDLIHYYQPKIVIATHSPLIVNSAELDFRGLKIFKGTGDGFKKVDTRVNNVEEVYRDFFNVTTPENRFLSQYVVKLINQLSSNTLQFNQFERIIKDLKESSYDEKQKEVLDGVLIMGRDIIFNI